VSTSQNINAVAWRGLLVAMALLGLCIAGFALVSSGGRIRTPAFIDEIAVMLSSPARNGPVKKSRDTTPSQDQVADPGARSGLAAGGGLGGSSAGGAAAHAAPPAANAAQALQQVLQQYRNDPKHTASVTISSTGRIMQSAPGPLTVHDGLPVEALNGSTEMQGSASGGAPAP